MPKPDGLTEAVDNYRHHALHAIERSVIWTAAERERHLLRITLTQEERLKGASQKDSEERATMRPEYSAKLAELEEFRVQKEKAEVEARIASYIVQGAIALAGAAPLLPSDGVPE